jgi:hypothetical protein
MKYNPYCFFTLIGLVLVFALCAPQLTEAQRFSHASFSRPSAPAAPRMEMSRPAPAPAVRNQPVRTEAAPPMNRTINGGSRNIGNHNIDVNRNVTVNEHVAVNPRADVNNRTNIYHTGGYRGIHPYYYHPYRPYYWGPRWHPVGYFLGALAANAFRFAIGNQWYYYDDGCYYIPSGSGYAVVMPPIGAVVSYLPDGYETCQVDNVYYYYYAGTFYAAVQNGYQVVQAPIGAVISQLPDGAVEQDFNGQSLLYYNNTYYLPISQDGQDAYQVVPNN